MKHPYVTVLVLGQYRIKNHSEFVTYHVFYEVLHINAKICKDLLVTNNK